MNEKAVQAFISKYPWLLNVNYEVVPGLPGVARKSVWQELCESTYCSRSELPANLSSSSSRQYRSTERKHWATTEYRVKSQMNFR